MNRPIQVGALFIFALTVVPPRLAGGQVAKGQFLVQPVVGAAYPYGELKKAARSGYTLGVSFDYMIADFISIGSDIQVVSFRSVRHGIRGDSWMMTDTSSARKFIQFGLTARFYASRRSRVGPFLEAGGSLFCAAFRDTMFYYRLSVVERLVVGYHFGGGLDARLTKALRAIARANYYSVVSPDRRSYLHYWTLRAGLGIQLRPL